MIKYLAVAALLLPLYGCDDEPQGPPMPKPINHGFPLYKIDQVNRRQFFKECMASLPVGPQSTQYNDWDEVVESCNRISQAQASICVANCETSAYLEQKQ